MNNPKKKAVGKGGNEEYIKKGAKSRVGRKRSINDRQKTVKQITITKNTDKLLDSLSMIYNVSRGEIIDEVIQATAIAYNITVNVYRVRPDFDNFEIKFTDSDI